MKCIATKRALKFTAVSCTLIALFLGTGYAENPDPSRNFSHKGKIDRITEKEVVIDDCLYRFSSRVHYASKSGKMIPPSMFMISDDVTFVLDKHSNIVVLKKER